MYNSRVIHGLSPIRSKSARLLILGSMPSAASIRAQQYYAHPHNAFWKIMTRLLGPAKNYKEKTALLKKHRIALWDVIASCEREGSLDSDIKKAVYNPLVQFLKKHPSIKLVVLNGGKAHSAYIRYAKANGLNLPFTRLPSTSPAHTMEFERKLKIWKRALTAAS